MTSLVTGATGFVGYHTAALLVERGEKVRLLVRPSSRLSNVNELDPALVELVVGDLADVESLTRAAAGCEMVYHVAADYRLWSANPQELYQSNVAGSLNVLDAARLAGARRVVYTSTVGALGHLADGGAANEESPVSEADMVGHYKLSKFRAEQEVIKRAADGQDVVIVNPSTPVGDHDIKPTPTGQIIVDFLNGKMPAYMDTGLNLVDVRDVAVGIVLAGEKGVCGRKYILGCENLTLKQILDTLAKISGRPAPRVRMPYVAAFAAVGLENVAARVLGRAPAHPLDGVRMARHPMFFDASRAVLELGMPQTPVACALERAVNWFYSNGYIRTR
jgi:dihydroflavonol-4-reductase